VLIFTCLTAEPVNGLRNTVFAVAYVACMMTIENPNLIGHFILPQGIVGAKFWWPYRL
jgi:hypothetical protein